MGVDIFQPQGELFGFIFKEKNKERDRVSACFGYVAQFQTLHVYKIEHDPKQRQQLSVPSLLRLHKSKIREKH